MACKGKMDDPPVAILASVLVRGEDVYRVSDLFALVSNLLSYSLSFRL